MAAQSKHRVFIYLSFTQMRLFYLFDIVCVKWIRNTPNKKYIYSLRYCSGIFWVFFCASKQKKNPFSPLRKYFSGRCVSLCGTYACSVCFSIRGRHKDKARPDILKARSCQCPVKRPPACKRCNNSGRQILQWSPIKHPLKHRLIFGIIG